MSLVDVLLEGVWGFGHRSTDQLALSSAKTYTFLTPR